MRNSVRVLVAGTLVLLASACLGSKNNGSSNTSANTGSKVTVAASATTSSAPAGTPVPASSGLTIYGDALANKWENNSWNSTTDLDVKDPVYSGTRAASVIITVPFGGLYFHTNTPVDMAPYTYLRFAARVTQLGQRYSAVLVDIQDKFIGAPIFIANYGDIPADQWKRYLIPLADLGGTNKPIKGIIFQDALGQTQPAAFFDDVGFQ